MWKETSAEPLRSDSMGIDIQIYLTEVPLPLTLPYPFLLLYSYLHSFSLTLSFPLSFSLTFAFSPRKTVTRNRCDLPGVGKGTGKKEFASRSFFFLLRPSILAGLDLERKPRRQMRASARGNCSSSILWAAFSSPEDLDLKKRDSVALQGPPIWTRDLKQAQWSIFETRWRNYGDLIGMFDDWSDGIVSCFSIYGAIDYIESIYTTFLWNIGRLKTVAGLLKVILLCFPKNILNI